MELKEGVPMSHKSLSPVVLFLGLVGLATSAMAGYPRVFESMSGYPSVFGPVVADVLGDGRFILYEGSGTSGGNIYIEDAAGSGTFGLVATGYQGDPGFIAVAPDGHTCLIGAGGVDWVGDIENDWVWLFDADNPSNAPATDPGTGYVADGLAIVRNNFWGVWIDSTHVLIESADEFWSGQIGILDVATGTYRVVVNKVGSTSSIVLGKGYMASYAFSTLGWDPNKGETRRFHVPSLLDIFNDAAYDPLTSPVPWTSGAVLGTYPDLNAGPSAVGDAGVLMFGSHVGQIAYVSPTNGELIGPASNVPLGGTGSVRPYYNAETRKVFVTETDWGAYTFSGYISEDKLAELPAAGAVALFALAAVLAAVARRGLQSRVL